MISIMTRNKALREWGGFALGIALILILIEAGSALRGDRLVFPSAGEIGKALGNLLASGKTYAQIGTTLLHVIEATAIAMAAGTVIGMAEGLAPFLHAVLRPVMILLRSLPMIVLVIMIMVVAQYRTVPLAAAVLVLLPIISEAAYEGVTRIDPELIDVYRMNSGLNMTILTRVYLPLIGGYMKQAFINACGMGLKVAVTSEYLVQTRNSLGKAIYSESYFNEYPEIYAYALIMVFLVAVLTGLPALIMRIRGGKKEEVTSG